MLVQVLMLEDGEELGCYSKFGELFPWQCLIYGVKSFREFNEGNMEIFPLLAVFLLNLSYDKDHVGGTSAFPKATLCF